MKKNLILILAFAMTLGLAACGSSYTKATIDAFNATNDEVAAVHGLIAENATIANENPIIIDEMNGLTGAMRAFKEEIESGHLTKERADAIVAELAGYSAQTTALQAKLEELIANGGAALTPATERQDNVTPEQASTIVDIMSKLGPLYNQAAEAVTKNGWAKDETALQELNAIYAAMESAKIGLEDPNGYGDTDTETLDSVVEQYQSILDAMPDILAKVSKPYGS